ncbi:MAG TPA: hypothetical protein VHZ96_24990 [Frankiaceae bacterium]|nr:hypothetical protein [Frankiaceae bacterium]
MRRWLLFGTALLITTAGAGGNAWAATTPAAGTVKLAAPKASARVIAGHESITPGTKQLIRLSGKTAQAQAQALPNATRSLVALPATAKINVTYVGFPAAARTAFQAAVNIWQTQIHSTVPIDVTADWSNLTAQYGDSSILGAAGPTDYVENFANAPVPNVAYPIALANAIAGSDQLPANVCTSDPNFPNPSGAEISASFNSDQSAWYYGTDGHPGFNQVDLESVVLHELGHGLGFVGSYDIPGDPSSGVGETGLTGDGQNLTIFDTFAADGSGHALDTTYANNSLALGNALRGQDGGIEWIGAAGDTAAAGHPVLYAPNPFQEGSSYAHLNEGTYPNGNANALMTPLLNLGEVTHGVGSIVLGMFKDMGWPQAGTPSAIGDYHVAAPMRLVATRTVTNASALTVQVTGLDGVPANATSVVVNVAVQSPTKAGYWAALPGCSGASLPDSQNFLAKQTRTSLSVLPVDDFGRIRISLAAVPAAAMSGIVSVDLVGWYSPNGVSYHQLPSQQRAYSGTATTSAVDVKMVGVAGIPTSGVTAVVMSASVMSGGGHGVLVVGPGGVTSIVPTLSYDSGELTSNTAIVPLGTGAGAGKIRVRTTAGAAIVGLNAVGWYGPSTAGGMAFHSAGPMHVPLAPAGQDVTIGGFPDSTPVMIDVHLSHPTVAGWFGAGPGGGTVTLAAQEFKAQQPTSGTTIVTTDATGRVHLHLSGGKATFYVDFQGWFSP